MISFCSLSVSNDCISLSDLVSNIFSCSLNTYRYSANECKKITKFKYSALIGLNQCPIGLGPHSFNVYSRKHCLLQKEKHLESVVKTFQPILVARTYSNYQVHKTSLGFKAFQQKNFLSFDALLSIARRKVALFLWCFDSVPFNLSCPFSSPSFKYLRWERNKDWWMGSRHGKCIACHQARFRETLESLQAIETQYRFFCHLTISQHHLYNLGSPRHCG